MIKPCHVMHDTLNGYHIHSNTIFTSTTSRYVFRHELRHAYQAQSKFGWALRTYSLLNRGDIGIFFLALYLIFPNVLTGFIATVKHLLAISLETDATLWALKRSDEKEIAFYGLSTYCIAFMEVLVFLFVPISKFFILLSIFISLCRYFYTKKNF